MKVSNHNTSLRLSPEQTRCIGVSTRHVLIGFYNKFRQMFPLFPNDMQLIPKSCMIHMICMSWLFRLNSRHSALHNVSTLCIVVHLELSPQGLTHYPSHNLGEPICEGTVRPRPNLRLGVTYLAPNRNSLHLLIIIIRLIFIIIYEAGFVLFGPTNRLKCPIPFA